MPDPNTMRRGNHVLFIKLICHSKELTGHNKELNFLQFLKIIFKIHRYIVISSTLKILLANYTFIHLEYSNII